MKYTTIDVLPLPAGVVLGLTEAQATLRAHALHPIAGRKGWFATTAPVQFKRGEQFLHDAELPKHLASGVDVPDEEKSRRAKAKTKTEAEAQAKAESEAKQKAEAKD